MRLIAILYAVLAFRCVASDASTFSVRSGLWSDSSVWASGSIPLVGDAVAIEGGHAIQLDYNATLASLVVSGRGSTLSCLGNDELSRRPDAATILFTVAAFQVINGACFSCGAGDCTRQPEEYAGRLNIRLSSAKPPTSASEDVRTMLIDGGTLHISGRKRRVAISRLASHAMANDQSILLSDASISHPTHGWVAGDLIAIAPTDYEPGQTEYKTILYVSRTESIERLPLAMVNISSPMQYSHNGLIFDISGSSRSRFVVDARAEVAVLSRDIVIEGTLGDPTGLGGDLKVTGKTSQIFMKWCELRYLGRRGHLGRYPLHLHAAGDGAIVENVVVHNSYQRGIVLHCTNGARVTDTVVAGVYGIAFMLEDGAEENNTLVGNLALDVQSALSTAVGNVPTEHGNPVGFWFVNPSNSFINNTAAGVRGSGFAWELLRNRTASYTLCPQDLPGYDAKALRESNYNALDMNVYSAMMKKSFSAFVNNTAHSMHSGLWFQGRGLDARTFYPEKPSIIDGFTAWKILPRSGIVPGVSLTHHDGCIHVFAIARLKFSRFACVNSPNVYWSTESNMLNGTLLAWLGNEGNEQTLIRGSNESTDDAWRGSQAMISYTNPQTFIDTHVHGKYGNAIFATLGAGSIASANTIIRGFSFDSGSVGPQFQLALLTSESSHAFTDMDGSWLKSGPGARILPSCLRCGNGTDPIIEAYAPGACVPAGTKDAGGNYVLHQPMSETTRPIGNIRNMKAALLVCKGPGAPILSVVQIDRFGQGASTSEINVLSVADNLFFRTLAPAVSRFFVPLTQRSMSAYGGYRFVSPTRWADLDAIKLSLGPMMATINDGMTLVFAEIPGTAEISIVPQWAGKVTIVGGAAPVTCASLVATCMESTCMCRDTTGDLYLRLSISQSTAFDPSTFDDAGALYLRRLRPVTIVLRRPGVHRVDAANDFLQLARFMESNHSRE